MNFFNNKKNKLRDKLNEKINGNIKKEMEEYLKQDPQEMIFDDAIKKDKRTFREYFTNRVKEKQITFNTFCLKEPLKPIPIKIFLFILDIELYIIVNAFFFSENYVSEIFHSTEEETFFSFIPRSIERFFYTSVVGVIFGYIVEFFFVEENKIKRIFKRNKENHIELRYEISVLLSSLQKKYIGFAIFGFILTFVAWYYISCFYNVYPHMFIEWVKSSIVIIIIMQIIPIIASFLETILRFISFKCKSERLFKFSSLLD